MKSIREWLPGYYEDRQGTEFKEFVTKHIWENKASSLEEAKVKVNRYIDIKIAWLETFKLNDRI